METIQQNAHGRLTRTYFSSARVVETVFLAALLTVSPACARRDGPTAIITEDTELVGLWLGAVTGPFGGSVLTLRLRADSTMSADNENPNYSRFDGRWTVQDDCFTATGSPSEGVVVTLIARAPFVRLKGTWTSNQSTGTFDLAKR